MQPICKLSIVIPCYNDHLYVEQAINSARAQDWNEKEIIVVDDGSDHLTKVKLKSIENKIDKLLFQENKGVSVARNKGIETATGEFILVLDSDDFFEPQFCTKAIDIFKNDKEVKIVTCYANWFDDRNSRIFKPGGGKLKNVLMKNIALGSMFKKQEWQSAGGYDEKMLLGYEDWEFYIRLLKEGGYVAVIPEVLFNYRNKKISRNKVANQSRYSIKEYIYNKHASLYKEHFSLIIHEWLESDRKNEINLQRVKNSLEYKLGNKLLKPLRSLGILKK